MDKAPQPEVSANRDGFHKTSVDETLNAVAVSDDVNHFFRSCTWPLRVPLRTCKGNRLFKLLNHQYREGVLLSDDGHHRSLDSPRSLLSRATQLALRHLDLGSSAPDNLSKVLNKRATVAASARPYTALSESYRLTSPPPSELSSGSSDERPATVPRNGILSTRSSHRNGHRAASFTFLAEDASLRKLDDAEISTESGYVASSTTPVASSSGSSSFKRKSTATRYHQVRIIDNRLKKPADEAALHARHRVCPSDRFSRSCASNDEEDGDEEEPDQEEERLPASTLASTTKDTMGVAAPTSSILVINPSAGGNNGAQKHVILLTGSSEPSPSLPSSEVNELRDVETSSIPPALVSLNGGGIHLPPDKRRHSSFVPTSINAMLQNKRGGCGNGALKRCNTTSSVYSGNGNGEQTPPTPAKSTLKAASVRRHQEYEKRRQRASLPFSPHPRASNSSPGVSRHIISSDEVETDNVGGGGVGGNLSRFSTPMEPICVVNLATPVSQNLSFGASEQQLRQRVNLLVEGVRFVVDVETLRAHPDTMLGRMFQSGFIESAAAGSYDGLVGYGNVHVTSGTTTCEDDDDDDDADDDDAEEEDEEAEVSGTSSVCSGGRTMDVEHWMASASTSTSRGVGGGAASGATHSAPASYRSHRGSLCGGGSGGLRRSRQGRRRTRRRQRQPSVQSHATNTSTDVCLSGAGVAANVFRVILDYYLLGKMTCPPDVSVRQLKQACESMHRILHHARMSFLSVEPVACEFLHEVSNDGAYRIFEQFLDEKIVPQFMKCAHMGERECHIVILTDDEQVHWDDEYPPQMPEAELTSHIIYSTRMYRFLKYIENREIAKQVLIERGLKKIRIGIEGYPTCKERMKFRVGSRPEAIYNYVQRPFLRMSWEQEENKSRHVDFQCVKSKSVSDLTSLDQAVIDRPLLASATAATGATNAPSPSQTTDGGGGGEGGEGVMVDPIPPRFSPSLPHHHQHIYAPR
ncbi:unnamed protein product [Taenia asiatica]|uniref:BTB_3 domain-containing protein n=1 Tax=Taenia asiatica TaxID=60517 RepID=A0A158R8V4_TAEAS|nr:unnamed protein product [Taenia asiatica]